MDLERPISSPSDQLIDWGDHASLPDKPRVETPGEIADRINKRLEPWLDIPIRWRKGIFRVPADASPQHYQRIRDKAVREFIRVMDKQGWDLHGRVQVWPSRFAATTETGVLLIGQREFVVRAQFEKRDCKRVRIEIASLLPSVN